MSSILGISASANVDQASGGAFKSFRRLARDSGDAVNVSTSAVTLSDALKKTAGTAKMTGSTVAAEVGSHAITFNNSTGVVTWDGKKLDLSGIGDTRVTRNLTFQLGTDSGTLNVYVGGSADSLGYKLDATTGKQVKDGNGNTEVATQQLDTTAATLVINNANMSNISNGGSGNDVIINRQLGADLDGGAGNDMIFNFAKRVGTLKDNDGENSFFSVGLTEGNIDATAAGSTYVKLLGNMANGKIDLGGGRNYIDAAGMTLTDVAITDASDAASTAIVAKSIAKSAANTAALTIALNAGETALDVATLAADLTLGAGNNSVAADTVKNQTITSTGKDTFQFKTLTNANIDSTGTDGTTAIRITGGATGSTFAMSGGVNSLDATGKTLTSVLIKDGGTGATTAIAAGSITGNATAKSDITLTGTAGTDSNSIIVSGALKFADVNTGDGKAEINAGSMTNATLTLGDESDSVIVQGATTNSTIDLGDGDNTFTAQNAKNNKYQAITNTAITASGTGSNTIQGGAYTAGTSGNSITMDTTGSNSVTLASIGVAKGYAGQADITMGGTAATVQTLTVTGTANKLKYTGSDGQDILTFNGALSNSSIDLGASEGSNANTLTVFNAAGTKGQAINNTLISAAATSSTIIAGGAYSAGADGNSIELGTGANTVTLNSIASAKGYAGGTTITMGGTAATTTQELTVKGAANKLDYTGSAGQDMLEFNGALSNSTIDLGASAVDAASNANTLKVQNAAGTKGQAINNTQITSGSTSATIITGGAYSAGADGNSIELGSGSNSVTLASIGSAKGYAGGTTITMGGSAATTSQDLTVGGAANKLTYIGSGGDDTMRVSGALTNSVVNLYAGAANGLYVQNGAKGMAITNTAISATTDSSTTIAAGAYTAGADGNSINLGTGANIVTLASIANAKGYASGTGITMGGADSTATQALTVTGTANMLNYIGSGGNDALTFNGALSNSDIDLGGGTSNALTVQNLAGTKGLDITNTNISATSTNATSTTITGGNYKVTQAGKAITLGEGANTVSLTGLTGTKDHTATMTMGGATVASTQTVNISGAAAYAKVSTGAGNDLVNILGAASQTEVALGDGDNTFTAAKTATGLTYTGGAGSDAVTIGDALTNSNINLGGGDTANTLTVAKAITNTGITASETSATTITGGAYVAGTAGNTISLGGGANDVTLASIANAKGYTGQTSITMGGTAATTTQALTVTGTVNNLTYTGSGEADNILINGAVNNSTFTLGAGDNALSARNADDSKRYVLTNVNITAGTGSDTLQYGGWVANKAGTYTIDLGEGDVQTIKVV